MKCGGSHIYECVCVCVRETEEKGGMEWNGRGTNGQRDASDSTSFLFPSPHIHFGLRFALFYILLLMCARIVTIPSVLLPRNQVHLSYPYLLWPNYWVSPYSMLLTQINRAGPDIKQAPSVKKKNICNSLTKLLK